MAVDNFHNTRCGDCVNNCGISRYRIFFHRIYNGNAMVINRLVSENPIPVRGSVYSFTVHLHSVGQKSIGDTCRSDSIPIGIIQPALFHRNRACLGSMPVGYDITGSRCSGHIGKVAAYCSFFDRIGDLCTAVLLIQVRKGCCPAVACIESLAKTGIHPVSEQLHGNACGSDAIPVIIILPHLAHADACLLRSMTVGYGIAGRHIPGNLFRIAGNYILIYRIENGKLPIFLIQSGKFSRPAVSGIQRLVLTGVCSVCVQSDNYFGSPQSVSVVIIFPFLPHGYVYRLCFLIFKKQIASGGEYLHLGRDRGNIQCGRRHDKIVWCRA